MDLIINIKNIKVNSISTIGSLNVGKAIFVKNQSNVTRCSKANYEEQDLEQEEVEKVFPHLSKSPMDNQESLGKKDIPF